VPPEDSLAAAPLRIALEPDAVTLRAIEVMVDRFELRRRAAPYAIRAYALDVLAESRAHTIADFVQENVTLTSCPRSRELCSYGRGRFTRPSVILNEAPLAGGLDALLGWPKDDFYLVEIGRSGGRVVVRAYTKWYIERITRPPGGGG
jgi:hypothetical protein